MSHFRTIDPVTVSLGLNPCHLTDAEDAAYDAFLVQVHNQQQAAWSQDDHKYLQAWRSLNNAIAMCDGCAASYWRFALGLADVPDMLMTLLNVDPSFVASDE